MNSKHIETNDEIQLVRYAVRMARELVERDTPNRVFSTDYHYCGNCKTQYLSEYQKFCDNCGQRLVWDKSDDYIKKLKEKSKMKIETINYT